MRYIITSLIILLFCANISAQNDLNCEPYKVGFFQFEGKFSDYVIYRTESHQIEYSIKTDEWVTIKLNWTSDCHYSFTYVSTNIDGLKQLIGQTIEVDILEGDDKGYTYHSVFKAAKKEFDGKIVFLTTEISKRKRKKIKKKLNKSKS